MRVATSETTFPANHSNRSRTHDPPEGPALWRSQADEGRALSENIRKSSVIDLNRALADSIVLRDLYKKHHWQVSGPTFRELHLLFDEHQAQQGELIDQIAERIMQLGGVSIAMGADAAEESEIPRPPRDREAPVAQLDRLLLAHEIVLSFARQAARRASEQGDDGTNDVFVSELIRLNEKQAWFVAEHLTNMKTE
ncbi:MAG: DNA starvation/stationary phase protection protein [Hyphomicrobiaceae bacterium]|nr:MAG: DNA starvation/stationary phase protection protein [Hyphomicrobiaceae bacterium]